MTPEELDAQLAPWQRKLYEGIIMLDGKPVECSFTLNYRSKAQDFVWNPETLERVREASANTLLNFPLMIAQADDVVSIFRGGFTSDDLRKEGPGFGVEMPGMDLEDDDGEWMAPPDVVR